MKLRIIKQFIKNFYGKGRFTRNDRAKNTIGVWSVVPEDLAGKAYQYHVHFENQHLTRDSIQSLPVQMANAQLLLPNRTRLLLVLRRQGKGKATWRLDN